MAVTSGRGRERVPGSQGEVRFSDSMKCRIGWKTVLLARCADKVLHNLYADTVRARRTKGAKRCSSASTFS